MTNSRVEKTLLNRYEGDKERVGFVLKHGKVVEVDNISDEPEKSFNVSDEDILKYVDIAEGTWHTHPNGDSNLSIGDMETFLEWPEIPHYIVGTDGVTKYIVKDGDVLID